MDLSILSGDDLALDVATGDVAVVTDGDGIMQDILVRLRTFRGEWFLNTDAGVPYFQDIFLKNVNLHRVSSVLKDAIIGTPGVTALTSFELSLTTATRALSLAFRAITEEGEISYEGSLL